MDVSQFRKPLYPLKTKEEWETELYPDGKCIYSGMQEKRLERIFDTCYPIISAELLNALATFLRGRRVLDVGAGTGYIARLLHDKGIDVRAIDSRNGPNTRTQWWEKELYFEVELADVLCMTEFDADVVVMTWPCKYTKFSEHVANCLKRGQFLIYQGEPRKGCTGTDEFFDLIGDRRRFARLQHDRIEEEEITQVMWSDYWSIYLAR